MCIFDNTDEEQQIARLLAATVLDEGLRRSAPVLAAEWVRSLRSDDGATLLDKLFSEYGLNNAEGVSLMCLAEALLRVPDTQTVEELIADKITTGQWQRHLGASDSFFINSSTWGLLLSGKILRQKTPEHSAILGKLLLRLGEPLIREITIRAVKLLAHKFVYAETITQALKNAAGQKQRFSFDMLGEEALTAQQAQRYYERYYHALQEIAAAADGDSPLTNHGISVKLSAIHPRFEYLKAAHIKSELRHKLDKLLTLAMEGNVAVTIDAEDFTRLALTREVIAEVIRAPCFRHWRGFGVVVQAYGKWAQAEIDHYYNLARELRRYFSIRLVKGAYWDTEIKHAQRDGFPAYPVYTEKHNSDISYLCCAVKLARMQEHIYPQFATHNAHTLAFVTALCAGRRFEVQRLFGMGQALHELVRRQQQAACRIYAPIGEHRDLLSYLVRRLLENGANQSFVSRLMNEEYSVADVVCDPLDKSAQPSRPALPLPPQLYGNGRKNSAGWILCRREPVAALTQQLEALRATHWRAGSLSAAASAHTGGQALQARNPADAEDIVGAYEMLSPDAVPRVMQAAMPWRADAATRRRVLHNAADLLEAQRVRLYSLLQRESGKVIADAIAEVREAVDFLRYYGLQCNDAQPPCGVVVCISPWNFPLAIFSGQVAAALAAANAVIAKPAESTNLIAHYAVSLLYQAGVPKSALQLLLGGGAELGSVLCRQPQVGAVAFTGSTATAAAINQTMAQHLPPDYNLVAETGGINAMIVDSTALPNQAIDDIITSAFRSAGQRCSALRVLYVQEEVYEEYLSLLCGRMAELTVDDPRRLATDIGPLISAQAKQDIADYVQRRRAQVLAPKRGAAEEIMRLDGHFFPPTLIAVDGIAEVSKEVFGPVLHIASFAAERLLSVVDDINAGGYGLTFAMHSRIDQRWAQASDRIRAGNVYINRDQIGAVVESQPFGGCGLSGTGPKAGGPNYLNTFYRYAAADDDESGNDSADAFCLAQLQAQIQAVQAETPQCAPQHQPGITGEDNLYSLVGRGVALCLGPGDTHSAAQAAACRAAGCAAVCASGAFPLQALENLAGIDAVLYYAGGERLRRARQHLSRRSGAIIPLLWHPAQKYLLSREQHLCINTTSAGGNVKLLARE